MDWGELQSALLFSAETLWATVVSGPAQRIYVAGMVATMLALAFKAALIHKNSLQDILSDPAYTEVKKRPGPKPRSDTKIDEHLASAAIRRRQSHLRIVSLAGQILLLGVVMPTLVFALATLFYQWFDPSAPPLVESQTLRPVPEVGNWQLLTYVIDNMLRGGLFDLMEVFRLHSTTVTNNVAAYPYSVGVFVYHLYVEGFLIFAVVTASRAIFVVNKTLKDERRVLNSQRRQLS